MQIPRQPSYSFSRILLQILFALPLCVSGQDTAVKSWVKEKVELSKGPGEDEWENEKKTTFHYDMFGREINNKVWRWDPQMTIWNITNEELSAYDQPGNRIFYHTITYNDHPEKLQERIEHREYENGRLMYRIITRRNYNLPGIEDKREWEVFYSYNDSGDRTETRVFYNNNEEFQGGYGFRWYYNDNACQTAFVNYDIDSRGSEIPVDSTHTLRDQFCNPTQQSSFEYRFNYFVMYFDQRFDYEYDGQGRVRRLEEFQRNSSFDEWEKIQEVEYEYDSLGLLISTFGLDLINNLESRRYSTYDWKQRLIHDVTQNKSSNEELWTTSFEFLQSFNVNDQVTKSESYFDWSNEAKEFNNISITENFYDESGYNFQTQTDLKFNQVRSRRETKRTFRCDGVQISEEVLFEEFGVEFNVRTENAERITYYNLAACEELGKGKTDFTIYPNPAQGYFHIYSENPPGESVLRIIDSNGQTVKRRAGLLSNYISIDTSTLEPGLYIIRIENNSGASSQKLVKN